MTLARNLIILAIAAVLLAAGTWWLTRGPKDISATIDPAAEIPALVGRATPDLAFEGATYAEPLPIVTERTLIQKEVQAKQGPRLECRIVVKDPVGGLIQGAKVHLQTNRETGLLGETNITGEVVARLTRRPSSVILVRSLGYQPSWTTLVNEGDWPSNLSIQLEYDGHIAGAVLQDGGARGVESGIQVAAWPDGFSPTRSQLSEVLSGRFVPGISHTQTLEGGAFVLDGLDPSQRYSLSAGGKGKLARFSNLSTPPVQSVLPSNIPVEILVDSLYGVRIRLRGAGGATLRTSPRVHGGGTTWEMSEAVIDDTVKDVSSAAMHLALLGISEINSLRVGPEGSTPWGDRIVLFRSEFARDRLGPLLYSVSAAGYQPVWTEFDLPSLENGLSSLQIELAPNVDEWGKVRILCSDSGGALFSPVKSSSQWFGKLTLNHESGSRYEVAVHTPDAGGEVIDGVPCGEYNVRFVTRAGTHYHPKSLNSPWKVSVQSSQAITDIDIPLEGLSGVVLEPFDETGAPFTGQVTLNLTRDIGLSQGRVSHSAFFPRPPYVFNGLNPGEWELSSIFSCPGRKLAEPVGFELQPGEVVRARMQLLSN